MIARAAVLALAAALPLRAQDDPSVVVDAQGVMRWAATQKEVVQFGVNYTAPFAYSFRAHRALGVPIEKAIDADVYHFARLGFDAYRVHIWDREISDPEGNLVVNEHVDALDYLLARLEERGIKIILTAMEFSDGGYPEPATPPPNGFSRKYGKQGCLENRESWPLQERYLGQLLAHVNRRTGRAYRSDPDIVAFEVCNEPGASDYALALAYIQSMVKAMRDAGCRKPILYNMSHGIPYFQAYLDAPVQGGTFQWYPSGLVAGHEQRGNFLPYVEDYPIPFAGNPLFAAKAKVFYEFDGADIGRSYLYPAIARSMRKAGAQFATQFAYDPLYLAAQNTEYQTHYLNLAYAPQKALSMKVAGEAFRRVPRNQGFGEYPADNRFEGVRVSYPDDLAEVATEEVFYYTNRTATAPPAPARLEHVAGYSTSPVVDYPGCGAYFLDRLEPGVWRLEVMPDAIWVRDPFEKASPRKDVSLIAWNEWPIRIDLPDLGPDFGAQALNAGNDYRDRAQGGTLRIRPGAYLLSRGGAATRWKGGDRWGNITLGEFVAPAASLDRTVVLHTPVVEAPAGEDLRIAATVASPGPVDRVELVAYPPLAPRVSDQRVPPGRRPQPGARPPNPWAPRTLEMTRSSGFEYSVDIPGSLLRTGTLRYYIAVRGPAGTVSFPPGMAGLPTDWDFYGEPWTARVVEAGAPILLFSAEKDAAAVTMDHPGPRYDLVPSERPGTSAMEVLVGDLSIGEHDHSWRFYFRDRINGRARDLRSARRLVLFGRSATGRPCPVQLALVSQDGIAYGAPTTVAPGFGAYGVPLAELRQVRSPNIPRGYPVFLHPWSSTEARIPFDSGNMESVLVSIGPGLPPADFGDVHGLDVERIWLE